MCIRDSCSIGWGSVTCKYDKAVFKNRAVYFQTPVGEAPGDGWPVVLNFHGWYLDGISAFVSSSSDEYGLFNKALATMALLDAGYAVVAPSASQKNMDAWETNAPPYSTDLSAWSKSQDAAYLEKLFTAMADGGLGDGCCNMKDMHAIGFSSGGYMTSRMAFSYQGKFRSLAIESASLYYCAGSGCPDPTAQDVPGLQEHPPTLLLHGTDDPIVPASTSAKYRQILEQYNIEVARYTMAGAGHQWIEKAPELILDWVSKHSLQQSLFSEWRAAPRPPVLSTDPTYRHAFRVEREGGCLHVFEDASNITLATQPCTPLSDHWVKWESGAIAAANHTDLCIVVPRKHCLVGEPLGLGSCFGTIPGNFFSLDDDDEGDPALMGGELVSRGCIGKCLTEKVSGNGSNDASPVPVLGDCDLDQRWQFKFSIL
eukprot:TRINITY_DN2985_c0_g2_i8.p1 TRINITY_DN2985_c0_g2~~TRINITY_DN2985_c0_g2_i8.p1  ORF type:complete len:427 (+),score=90.66 TRINITY_DN2985_c0_g2_i8:52-1332(+)